MSLLQLVGGVAAAGVIAAGTTAFTASGVTLDTSAVTADKLFLGGGLSITATGTQVNAVTFGWNDASTHQQLNKVTLGFTDTNSANGKVTLVTSGTATQPTWTCGAVSAKTSVCDADSSGYVDLTTGTLTTLAVTVAPA